MTTPEPAVRDATPDDAAAVAAIYDHYVVDTIATFECEPIGTEAMAERIAGVVADGYPYLVATLGGRVVGYSYAARFRPRAAYLHSVETTVYLAPDLIGAGVGTALYRELLTRLERLECPSTVHSAFAVIALPNKASIALHERFGFTWVGLLPEAGWKLGRWIDVGYWHRLIGGEPRPDHEGR